MRASRFPAMLLVAVGMQAIVAKPPDWIPPEMLDMVKEDKGRCMSEHGTTQDLIDKVNDGMMVDDRGLACYMYCLLEAFSVADEDGNLDTDVLLSVLPEKLASKAPAILGTCGNMDGSDACDKIMNIAKCVQSKAPDLWFMV